MKLTKSLLLGSAAAVVAVSAGYAADLPSKKAAPASYVKVCDAYGAGFFYIPGTDTCLKIGGKVRVDYAYTPAQSQVSQKYTAAAAASKYSGTFNSGTTYANAAASKWDASKTYLDGGLETTTGYEARAAISLDARTQTSWGTLQTVFTERMTNQTGVLAAAGFDAKTASTSTVEAAYIRFAGFTAGRASEITAFMPGSPNIFTAGGHWASYANGVIQLAYTAVLGGGLSATIGIEDPSDFNNVSVGADGIGGAYVPAPGSAGASSGYVMTSPVVAGNIMYDQSWGTVGVTGSLINNNFTSQDATAASDPVNKASATGWSTTAVAKINLPQLAAGDTLWLTAGYTEGFLDQVLGWGNFKSTDVKNFVGGAIYTPASFYVFQDASGNWHNEQTKAWNVAGDFLHYWTSSLRSNFQVSYAAVTPGSYTQTITFTNGGLQKMNFTTVGANLIWSPVQDFDIGVEALYQRVGQSYASGDTSVAGYNYASSYNNTEARMRVDRRF